MICHWEMVDGRQSGGRPHLLRRSSARRALARCTQRVQP